MSSRLEYKPQKRKKQKIQEKKWLIFCNGVTEALYFESYIEHIGIDKNKIEVKSTGYNTRSLVELSNRLYGSIYPINHNYDRIFCVYDRDSFKDFDESVRLGESYGYDVIWSNECFELWFILHKNLLKAAQTRDQYFKELTNIFRKIEVLSKDENYKDDGKTIENIFEIVSCKIGGNIRNAKRNSDKLYEENKHMSPSKQNPATKVHILLAELETLIKK